MGTGRDGLNRLAGRAVVGTALAISLFLGGMVWRGLAATPPVSASPPATLPSVSPLHSGTARVDSYADTVNAVAPAVVTIRVEGNAQMSPTSSQDDDFFRRFFGDQFNGGPFGPRTFRQRGLGSGVVVSPDGYILTNQHVVDHADDIRVDLNDGRTLKAKLIGSDAPSDLALLRIDATNLRALPLGNSDSVQVGDVVLAVGNPLGVGQTVTMGIISAKGRSTGLGDGSYEDFLQTDAPINQGNSGGALVNTKGELIGINSQILSTSEGNIGIGFAIPANMADHVMRQLRSEGRVRRGQLGVTVQSVTSDLAASLGLQSVGGAIVSSVEPGSAAARGGVERGDVITSFNGQPIHDANVLRNRVADAAPDSRASLFVTRGGSERHLSVTFDEAASNADRGGRRESGNDNSSLGIAVVPLTPELALQMGLPKTTRGLVVQDVDPDGRAADAGLQRGDIIEQVNNQAVLSPGDLRAGLRATSDRPALLLVNRDGRDLYLSVRTS